jgi:hypothetical protein
MLKREDILSMVPGRELDALVAEKVMGWKYKRMTGYKEDAFESSDLKLVFVSDWTPSSYIHLAWKVFEKGDFDKEKSSIVHGSMGQWTCHFDDVSSNACSTAPLAICRAALLAVME